MIGEYPVAESQADRLKATAPEARRHLRARRGVGRPVAAVGWNPRYRRQFSLRWPPRYSRRANPPAALDRRGRL
jgi:hypothetical protein